MDPDGSLLGYPYNQTIGNTGSNAQSIGLAGATSLPIDPTLGANVGSTNAGTSTSFIRQMLQGQTQMHRMSAMSAFGQETPNTSQPYPQGHSYLQGRPQGKIIYPLFVYKICITNNPLSYSYLWQSHFIAWHESVSTDTGTFWSSCRRHSGPFTATTVPTSTEPRHEHSAFLSYSRGGRC